MMQEKYDKKKVKDHNNGKRMNGNPIQESFIS